MMICEIKDLFVDYEVKQGLFKKDYLSAVSDLSLNICEGDIFGIVGESGCGKSSLCNAILGFVKIKSGSIKLFDKELNYDKDKLKEYRKNIDVIFQNPFSSLNPRLKVWQIISEPLYLKGIKKEDILKEEALKMLIEVGLTKDDLDRYIFEFSGGQRQRIAIARSLINKPKFIVLDEPTSALDVSIQAQIANLLKELKDKYNLTYLLVSHNLGLIYQLTNRLAVMYCGQVVETGSTEKIFKNPTHPYTKGLLSSFLDPKTDDNKYFYYDLIGEAKSTLNADLKCRFYDRCPFKKDVCLKEDNKLVKIEEEHYVSCKLI